jgi:hypothetical protein
MIVSASAWIRIRIENSGLMGPLDRIRILTSDSDLGRPNCHHQKDNVYKELKFLSSHTKQGTADP